VPDLLTFAAALALAGAFPLARYCQRFTSRVKHTWQALSAGVAIAYVFIHVLPELEEHQRHSTASPVEALLHAEKHIYLWALAGFVLFAGLSRLRSLQASANSGRARTSFWTIMAGYSSYCLLIGYVMVHRRDATDLTLGPFVFAMALHLFMVDSELTERYPALYGTPTRILLSGGLLLGWGLGVADALPISFTSRLFAFVAGGVVILAANEELPTREDGRFWWFVAGSVFYSALLLLL